jgi:putative heme iron utilization protein
MTNNTNNYEQHAVALLRSSDAAILSTLSRNFDNYPFGSFITFVSNTNRELFLYASDIAEHTKNFINDPRACITITSIEDKGDQQNSARLSLMGDISKVEQADLQHCQRRFFAFMPESEKYSRIHDFNFYKFKTIKARWIGGFGEIAWLNTEHWQSTVPEWRKNEQAMIRHMNQDHANVISSALYGQLNIKDRSAKMIALSIDGYYALSNKQKYFISFDQPCYTEKVLRDTLIKQAQAYREFELN